MSMGVVEYHCTLPCCLCYDYNPSLIMPAKTKLMSPYIHTYIYSEARLEHTQKCATPLASSATSICSSFLLSIVCDPNPLHEAMKNGYILRAVVLSFIQILSMKLCLCMHYRRWPMQTRKKKNLIDTESKREK